MESDQVSADMIEVSEFPDLADRHQIRSVPYTVVNDRVSFTGSLPEPKLLEQVMAAVAVPAASSRNQQT